MHHLGHTRSASRRDHLLHTPDTFVRTPLPGLAGGMAIVHAAPQMGAGFAMMTVEFASGGSLEAGPAQRFVYVLEGSLEVSDAPTPLVLEPGGFVFSPDIQGRRLEAQTASRAIVIDKPYVLLHPSAVPDPHASAPEFLAGTENDVTAIALNGDPDLQVRSLLPSEMGFDFAVNTMTYAPGASLAQVEVHYMEHGLLMLEGAGIYRLGDAWYPVEAGDFIWMAPFCPQWFGALGKGPAKYLIYKDVNRHVLA